MDRIKPFKLFEAESDGGFIQPSDRDYFRAVKFRRLMKSEEEDVDWPAIRRIMEDALSPELNYNRFAGPDSPFAGRISRAITSDLRGKVGKFFVFTTPLSGRLRNLLPGGSGTVELSVFISHYDDYYYVSTRTQMLTPDGKFVFTYEFRADGIAGLKRLFGRIKEWLSHCRSLTGETRPDIKGATKKPIWRHIRAI